MVVEGSMFHRRVWTIGATMLLGTLILCGCGSNKGAVALTSGSASVNTGQSRASQTSAGAPPVASSSLASRGPVPVPRPATPPRPQPEAITAQFPPTKMNPSAVTSLWFLDYAPVAQNLTWDPIYLIAWTPSRSGTASLWRTGINSGLDQQMWECPRSVGDIHITAVSGLNGIVQFQTSTGGKGTLDMSTGKWSFA